MNNLITSLVLFSSLLVPSTLKEARLSLPTTKADIGSGSQILRLLNVEDYIYEKDPEDPGAEKNLVHQFEDYAREVRKILFENSIRVNIDNASGNFQNKLYRAVDLKVPYIVTIGKKEYQNKTIQVRKGDSTRNMTLDELIEEVKSCLKKS